MAFSLVWLLLLILKVPENQQLNKVRWSFPDQAGKLHVYKQHTSPQQQNQTDYEVKHGYCWKALKVVMF